MMIIISDITTIKLTKEQKERLFELMTIAYAKTENDIWGEDYFRLDRPEYFELLDKDQFFIAFKDDRIVGSILVYQKDLKTYGFGLLNVDFEETGQRIGHLLIESAEKYAKEHGGSKMQLEILRAEAPVSEFKLWLARWYEDQGYKFIGTFPFEYVEPNRPEKRQNMQTEAVFDIYTKEV